MPSVTNDNSSSSRPRNLSWLVSRRFLCLRVTGAIASGLLLSAAFPPIEWDIMGWVFLLPLLCIAPPPGAGRRALLGYVFGLAHFLPSLAWLNEIGFAAGVLLALICGLFPMFWYIIVLRIIDVLAPASPPDAPPMPPSPPVAIAGALNQCMVALSAAAVWVALEWTRGWIFTGFPWNQIGGTQWRRLTLLQLTTVTGIFGLSFLLIAFNMAFGCTIYDWYRSFRLGKPSRRLSWPLGMVVALLLPSLWIASHAPRLPAPDQTLRVLAVQGNIPQCRAFTPEQLQLCFAVYMDLTRQGVPATKPDLVVWPETAIPAPLYHEQYRTLLGELLADTQTPLLIGAVDFRRIPLTDEPDEDGERDDVRGFNSAFYIGTDGSVLDHYDKIHLVPFGEFTPFESYLPWLRDIIGMGRSLTPGREFTVLRLPNGARAGVNICFEDTFPGISRGFVIRGANVLMTLTNDAWYAESSGSRQHMLHTIFRAVEHRRPLFRSGNNSDTCLILPNGRVTDLLEDPVTGDRFIRGSRTYSIPIWNNETLGMTFYTKHGDLFAQGCVLLTLAILCGLTYHWLRQKRRLFEVVTEKPQPPSSTSDGAEPRTT